MNGCTFSKMLSLSLINGNGPMSFETGRHQLLQGFHKQDSSCSFVGLYQRWAKSGNRGGHMSGQSILLDKLDQDNVTQFDLNV